MQARGKAETRIHLYPKLQEALRKQGQRQSDLICTSWKNIPDVFPVSAVKEKGSKENVFAGMDLHRFSMRFVKQMG